MNPDAKIEWLISSGSLNDMAAYHEVCEVIRVAYPKSTTQARQDLIAAIRTAVVNEHMEGNGYEDFDDQLYNWFDILLRSDPDCELAQTAFQEVQKKHLEWEPQQSPDTLTIPPQAYYVIGRSPWAIAELLSLPGNEWVETVLNYEPPSQWESVSGGLLHEKRASKAVRDATAQNAAWGIEFARELVRRSEWHRKWWSELVAAWEKSDLDEHQLCEILGFMRSSELRHSIGHWVTEFLYSLVDNGGKSSAEKWLPGAKSLARSIWDEAEDETISNQTDWFTCALNTNAGMVVRFWLSALWVQSKSGTQRNGKLADDDREFFDLVVDDTGKRGKLGQAMLTSHLGYLLSYDDEWTKDSLLPLFEQEHGSFVPAWHGFTWSPLTPGVGGLMKSQFLRAVKNIQMLGRVGVPQRRSEFVRRYASMMIYVVNDRMDEWIEALFNNADNEDLGTFAWEIGRILENMADAQKLELWDRWLRKYWDDRVLGIPKPLVSDEVEEMIRWPRDLSVVFDYAVALTVKMPITTLSSFRVAEHIVNEELARNYPEGTARMIEFIDRIETRFCLFDGIEQIFDILAESGLDDTRKRKIKHIRVKWGESVLA